MSYLLVLAKKEDKIAAKITKIPTESWNTGKGREEELWVILSNTAPEKGEHSIWCPVLLQYQEAHFFLHVTQDTS